ncbi:hypothetical protein BDV24DRAFT_160009 [Aspergillus arachidicola]|uniref:Uncharacterized protein n=1 Tax=Aspergillus arachidicola TaxID=656916 RepID=A0A5N6YI38_9EURO|nr:hypothetical protein BDV24DRAFT_160009 [Aspergillus arachidicola]
MEEAAFRMVLATPNSSKYRSSISFSIGQESPVLYNTFDSVDGFPSIMADTSNNTQTCTVSISFQTPEDSDYFQSCLIGLSSHPDNQKMSFDVQSLSVSELKRLGGEAASSSKPEFGRANTIVIGPLLNHSLNHDQEKEPELLRIVNLIERGSFVDRIIGDLESLKIGLDVMKTNSIQLYRTEQPRLLTTVSSSDQASQGARDAMKEMGKLMSKGFPSSL